MTSMQLSSNTLKYHMWDKLQKAAERFRVLMKGKDTTQSQFNPLDDPHFDETLQDFLSLYTAEELLREPHIPQYILEQLARWGRWSSRGRAPALCFEAACVGGLSFLNKTGNAPSELTARGDARLARLLAGLVIDVVEPMARNQGGAVRDKAVGIVADEFLARAATPRVAKSAKKRMKERETIVRVSSVSDEMNNDPKYRTHRTSDKVLENQLFKPSEIPVSPTTQKVATRFPGQKIQGAPWGNRGDSRGRREAGREDAMRPFQSHHSPENRSERSKNPIPPRIRQGSNPDVHDPYFQNTHSNEQRLPPPPRSRKGSLEANQNQLIYEANRSRKVSDPSQNYYIPPASEDYFKRPEASVPNSFPRAMRLYNVPPHMQHESGPQSDYQRARSPRNQVDELRNIQARKDSMPDLGMMVEQMGFERPRSRKGSSDHPRKHSDGSSPYQRSGPPGEGQGPSHYQRSPSFGDGQGPPRLRKPSEDGTRMNPGGRTPADMYNHNQPDPRYQIQNEVYEMNRYRKASMDQPRPVAQHFRHPSDTINFGDIQQSSKMQGNILPNRKPGRMMHPQMNQPNSQPQQRTFIPPARGQSQPNIWTGENALSPPPGHSQFKRPNEGAIPPKEMQYPRRKSEDVPHYPRRRSQEEARRYPEMPQRPKTPNVRVQPNPIESARKASIANVVNYEAINARKGSSGSDNLNFLQSVLAECEDYIDDLDKPKSK